VMINCRKSIKGVIMNIEVMALCDAATESQGKLNILGAFDTIYSKNLPATHRLCAVALRMRFSQIEKGEHKIRLNLVDEDGKFILPALETKAKIDFPPHVDSCAINIVLNIQGLKFEKYGKYALDLAIDGRQEGSLPIYLRQP